VSRKGARREPEGSEKGEIPKIQDRKSKIEDPMTNIRYLSKLSKQVMLVLYCKFVSMRK
jgi:hypothetical protein